MYRIDRSARVIGRARPRPGLSGGRAAGGGERWRRCVRHWRWRSWPPRRRRPRTTSSWSSRATGATGAKGNGNSFQALITQAISADGRFVAFRSTASNLDPDDDDATQDVFVRDLQTSTTTLVSRATGVAGAKGNDASDGVAISADGRFVAFHSDATNLHPDDGDDDKTCSCATCRRTPPRWSAAPPAQPATRATATLHTPRSRPTGASSPSTQTPRTSPRRRRLRQRRVRARPADEHHHAGQPRHRRRRRQRGQLLRGAPRSRPTGASWRSSPRP